MQNSRSAQHCILHTVHNETFPSSCFLAARASMAFRSSFASVPLQVTFARGRKALAALTEHPLRRSAVQRLQLLSGISVRHQAGLNVAKQPDFSIGHRTLLRYRFVHGRRYHDSTCNAASAMPLPRHESTSSHGISTRYEVIAPFMLGTDPIPSSIRTLRVYVIESMSIFFWLCMPLR